jgi:surfeit locus 1 family protein
MSAGYSFRPRLWALALGAAACAAGIALGNWQSGRADAKRAAAKTERVAVRGEFLAERTVLLDNKLRHGRAGYEVITPLRLNASTYVLVNRGWIEAGPSRDALPAVRTPLKEVVVEGIALARLPRVLDLEKKSPGKVRQSLDIAAFAAETGLALEPRVIEQHSATDDGLLREWPRPDAGIEKHESYALQWYSLAGLALVLAIVLSFRRVAPH